MFRSNSQLPSERFTATEDFYPNFSLPTSEPDADLRGLAKPYLMYKIGKYLIFLVKIDIITLPAI